MLAPDDRNRRPSARESIELCVRYQRMNTFFADYVKNISRGGTFVATDEPLPQDTEFTFLLSVPELPEPLALRAKVMWTTAPEAASTVHPAGMGIQFQFRDAADKSRTEAVIEGLLIDHLGQHHAERLLRRPLAAGLLGRE
jgi:type IV pilus assembly protein PilZ